MSKQIVLASQSPRRKDLMRQANIEFEVIVQPTEEDYPSDMPIAHVPLYIATNKAKAVAASCENKIIVAADTVVVLNNTIIGKPVDKANAMAIIQQLQNNVHEVITGVHITDGGKEVSFSCTTKVFFLPLTPAQIEYYVDTYKPYDKAGAYAIQEWIGAVGIEKIDGDFYNVMGLPINRVYSILQNW